MQKIAQLEKGPQSHTILPVTTAIPTHYRLSSGIDLYALRTKGIGAIKIELIFEAGRLYETKRLVAQACGSLLSEGCHGWSSADISEFVDFQGAYLSTYSNPDFITLRLTCAAKSLSTLLPLLKDILAEPKFSDEELGIFIERRKQKMAVNLTKNDVIGYRAITGSIYGDETPYGYNSNENMLDDLGSSDLSQHYESFCTKESVNVFLSGDYSDEHIKEVEDLCSVIKDLEGRQPKYAVTTSETSLIEKEGRENQASLKLGRHLFSRKGNDYAGMYLLNTIVGGYFGSRLMKNIREKRGYTYNIYSMLDTYKHDGAWIISCELDKENIYPTIEQIEYEFGQLRNKPISKEELEMVKNYMMGNFMSTINGPFKSINPYKTQVLMGLDDAFYNRLFRTIKGLSAEDILRLANQFLIPDNFWKVIVGNY